MPPPLLSPTELAYLHTSLTLTPPIRPDARSPTTFRPLIAETDLLPSANGSARLCFADGTEAIVGVKGVVERTSARGLEPGESIGAAGGRKEADGGNVMMAGVDSAEGGEDGEGRGEDGWVEVSIDVPGQRDEDGTTGFLAEIIREGLVADGMLRGRLWINGGWHWRVYIDILLLSPPATYPLPLLSLSTHLALLSTRLPALISTGDEDPLFNDDWDAALPLYTTSSSKPSTNTIEKTGSSSKPPITLLVIAVGENIFFDPSRGELAVADGVVAVTITSTSSSPLTTNISQSHQSENMKLLAIRAIDPPSRLTVPATSTSATQTTSAEGEVSDADTGLWTPKRGGVSRGVLRKMVGLCLTRGGVGEEVLGGLAGFV